MGVRAMTGAADNGATLLDSKKKLISKTYLRNAWYVAAARWNVAFNRKRKRTDRQQKADIWLLP